MKRTSCFSTPTRPALEATELATRIKFRFEQARVDDKPYIVLNIRLFDVQTKGRLGAQRLLRTNFDPSLRQNQQGPYATNRQHSSIPLWCFPWAMAIGASFMSADTSPNTAFPTAPRHTQTLSPSTGAGTLSSHAQVLPQTEPSSSSRSPRARLFVCGPEGLATPHHHRRARSEHVWLP
jgi:hypothetical protein